MSFVVQLALTGRPLHGLLVLAGIAAAGLSLRQDQRSRRERAGAERR